MAAVRFPATCPEGLKRRAENRLGDLRFTALRQLQRFTFIDRFTARFIEHFLRRLAVRGDDRHTDGERFAQNQRVVINARRKEQRVHLIQLIHQLAFVGQKAVVNHVGAFKRRELAEGVDFHFIAKRHQIAHQALIGFAVVTQIVRHHRDFRRAGTRRHQRQFGENGFCRHIDAVIDNFAAPCPVEAVKGVGHVLAWRNKVAAERQHVAKTLAFVIDQAVGAVDFHRRIVIERRALLAAGFPAFAAVKKRTAASHAPVIVQRPDESDITLMRF